MKKPNVILVQEGRGMGWNLLCISLHECYSDYAAFMRTHDAELSDYVVESQTFQADLNPGVTIKPFSLKYLANLSINDKANQAATTSRASTKNSK